MAEAAPATLRLLSHAWGRLGGTRPGRAILRLLRARSVGRAWAHASVLRSVRALPDDVTVLIGVRNRTDHRIVNALRSVLDQSYPWGRVTALVIDYGSDGSEAEPLADLCSRLGATLLRVEASGPWSRSRCLNVGLRQVRTKYVMTSDADVVLSRDYLADAVTAIRADPFAVVCSLMLDQDEDSVETMQRAADADDGLDLVGLRPACKPRFEWEMHPSIAVTLTAYHRAIRGYDEFYEGWGREDEDLMRRFTSLGLRPAVISPQSFYLHQWHPKYEGIPADARERFIARNNEYFVRTRSILRNDETWSAGSDSAATAAGSGRPPRAPPAR